MSQQPFNSDGGFSTTGNVTANSFIGDGSQLTGLPASYSDSNVATFLANYGSNTVSTTGNVTANIISATNNGNGTNFKVGDDIWLGDVSVADTMSLRGQQNSANAYLLFGNADTTSTLGRSGSGPLTYNGAFAANTITLSGTGTAVNAGSGNILTNKVTGTQFAFLNGIYTATLTGSGATSDYTLNLPANVGTNGQSLTSDGTGNLVWTTPASSYGNANVATFLASFGSNAISTTGNITAGNLLLPNTTANTQILFNNNGTIDGVSQFTFDPSGNTLTLANNNSTLKVADIQTPAGGVSLRLIPASGITYSYGNFLPLFANTYDLGGSGSRWNSVFANVANVVTLNTVGNVNAVGGTFSGNVTAQNFTGNISITGNVTGTSANVSLVAGAYTWTFNNTGNLVLPGNTFAVNYANGTAVSLGGGSYGNANVADFLDSLGSNAIVTTGNITGGNLISSATIFGNPDIVLGNIANASATKTRMVTDTTFSYIQTGNGTVGSTGNIVFSPYASATQRVVIDTASGNITANGFVRGLELTSTNSVGNEGGQINLAIPGANTTLQNIVTVDVYQNQFRIFEGSANAKGAYIDLASCASGVGTNLVNRASIIAAANTAVTLDNIQARVGGSPTRLYINTVSGNLTGAGQSQTLLSGSTAVSSWINVPIGQGAANAFAMSGALTSNGDTAILSLIDQGSGTGMWRITGMIANTSSNLYGVTIERLV